MAVLKLPIEPRELSVSLIRRRSPQESVFTGAVQHVISAGAVWQGYIDLPPILSQRTWDKCKQVIGKVITGEDRLFVPVVEGHFDTATSYIDQYPEFTAEQFCALDLRATLNKEGNLMLLSHPRYERAGGGHSSATWDTDSLFLEGASISLLWYTLISGSNEAILDRAALTHCVLRQRGAFNDLTEISDTDRAEISTVALLGQTLAPHDKLWSNPDAGPVDIWSGGPTTDVGTDEIDLLTLSPAVPQMFREETATADGNWCVVQANFCRPHIPAVILNDDALGHTISDRAILPNRIEFISSSIY